MLIIIVLITLLVGLASSQQVGNLTAEVHPPLTWQTCTAAGTCTTNNGKIVLDAQQVSVGKTLLNKVLPDLSATTISGEGEGGSISFTVVYEAAKPKA